MIPETLDDILGSQILDMRYLINSVHHKTVTAAVAKISRLGYPYYEISFEPGFLKMAFGPWPYGMACKRAGIHSQPSNPDWMVGWTATIRLRQHYYEGRSYLTPSFVDWKGRPDE